jgi:hypothetical protein
MPKATPPAPITHTAPRSPMPMPMDASPAPMPAQQPVSPGQFYSYASQQLDSTVPVPPLPFAELATASVPRQIPRWSRIVMPIGGVVAVIAFAAAFFATRDHRPELPTIASVSRAEPVAAAAAAPAPAVIPADSHWKPRAVAPTIAAEAPRTPTAIDSAAVDAAVEAATAVDATAVDATANDAVDPVVVAKPVAAKTIVRPKKRVHKPAKKAHRITRSSTKRRRVTVDASSPLGGLRPGMAW